MTTLSTRYFTVAWQGGINDTVSAATASAATGGACTAGITVAARGSNWVPGISITTRRSASRWEATAIIRAAGAACTGRPPTATAGSAVCGVDFRISRATLGGVTTCESCAAVTAWRSRAIAAVTAVAYGIPRRGRQSANGSRHKGGG